MKKRFTLVASAVALFVASFTVPSDVPARGPVPSARKAGERKTTRPVPPRSTINIYQKNLLESYASGALAAVPDTLNVLAVRVEFPDTTIETGRDSAFVANEMKHLTEYFRGASRGRQVVEWSVPGRVYRLPKVAGYYGNDNFEEQRVVEMVRTVIDSADAEIDFSLYDMILVIHAGAGQETDLNDDSRGQIWSSFYDRGDIDDAIPDSTVTGLATGDTLDGEPYYVDNFAVVPVRASQDFAIVGTLGVWVFEVASRLGLLPMFDSTPPGFVDSQGIGSFGLMAFGLFNAEGFVPAFPCAFNRMIAGWVDPVTVFPEAGATESIRLADINTGADADTVCLKIPITNNEYYLVVNRVHDANFDSLFTFADFDSNLIPNNADSLGGAEFDFFLTDLTNPSVRRFDPNYGFDVLLRHTGSGVYVWHVDEAVVAAAVAMGGLPNDSAEHKGVDLEEADGVQDLDAGGVAAFALGSFFDSFRSGDGNANSFGPSTTPDSRSNSGVRTGIVIENISVPGPVMTLDIRIANDYDESRTTWIGAGDQPGTPVDLDASGPLEIVVLADTGGVYAFDDTGAEFNDSDANPATLDPYIAVPGVAWVGPPAVGNLDVSPDLEIVAADRTGFLYAWKGSGVELIDGDFDPLTDGVLYHGAPMPAPPLLFDFNDDGREDVLVVENIGDSLRLAFVPPTGGGLIIPGGPRFGPNWPVMVQGQYAAPPSLARTRIGAAAEETGVVFSWVDTLSGTAGVSYTPIRFTGSGGTSTQPAPTWLGTYPLEPGIPPSSQLPSPAAVGDIDGDGNDEAVVALRDGRVIIFEVESVRRPSSTVVALRSANPSSPALGDVDLDGAMEIAVFDDEFLYLLESNGRSATNWPYRLPPRGAGVTTRRSLESPVIGDVDGDGAIEVLYPFRDGTVYGFENNGSPAPGFPRVSPAGASATPTLVSLAGGELSLVVVGVVETLRGIDTVSDGVTTVPEMTLSIQTLPGSEAAGRRFWALYGADAARSGLVSGGVALKTATSPVEAGSFMIYPNPVPGDDVHARVILNRTATVRVEIFNFEGERAFEGRYTANPNGLIATPFDEAIDVADLVSGVYFLRLRIEGSGGGETLVKPFAIRR